MYDNSEGLFLARNQITKMHDLVSKKKLVRHRKISRLHVLPSSSFPYLHKKMAEGNTDSRDLHIEGT